jgi:hypothetical protein
VQFDGVGEDPKRHEGKYEPARNVHPDVAGNSYPINVDCSDHEDETNDQVDQHSEPQKSPTVHRSMFSAYKAGRKQKYDQPKPSDFGSTKGRRIDYTISFSKGGEY